MEKRDVRAVFFDAGYTLLCMEPDQETLFLRTCAKMDVVIDINKLSTAVKHANVMLGPKPANAVPVPFSQDSVDRFWITYHRELLAGCATEVGAADFAPDIYRAFTAALDWRVYDDVRDLLASLRSRGLALGVVSNWTGDLDSVLDRIGLRAEFDFVLDSAHFGFEKPHPDIFVEALRRAGCAPHNALHVGDSPEHDVDGALASGLHAVLLDRHDRHVSFSRSPRVRTLSEIPTFL